MSLECASGALLNNTVSKEYNITELASLFSPPSSIKICRTTGKPLFTFQQAGEHNFVASKLLIATALIRSAKDGTQLLVSEKSFGIGNI
jgi:hypothetical protein